MFILAIVNIRRQFQVERSDMLTIHLLTLLTVLSTATARKIYGKLVYTIHQISMFSIIHNFFVYIPLSHDLSFFNAHNLYSIIPGTDGPPHIPTVESGTEEPVPIPGNVHSSVF